MEDRETETETDLVKVLGPGQGIPRERPSRIKCLAPRLLVCVNDPGETRFLDRVDYAISHTSHTILIRPGSRAVGLVDHASHGARVIEKR